MYAYLISAMLLLTAAPLAVRAEEPPTPPAEEETQATEASAEELPYGSGYEARQRAQQQEQARSREQAGQRDRSEARSPGMEARPARSDVERAPSPRDARREARERRTPRGPGG